MGTENRDYMKREIPEADLLLGVEAETQAEAEKLLKFACPTQLADGRWYRCTVAVSNVPVCELYNVLSNLNFIIQHLRELSERSDEATGKEIQMRCRQLQFLRTLVFRRDSGERQAIIDGLNIHAPM